MCGQRILMVQNRHQRIKVEGSQRPSGRQGADRVADKQIIIRKPDVGLHARTSSRERIKQRHFTPVVIMRMARDRSNISAKARGVLSVYLRRWRTRRAPFGDDSINVIPGNQASQMDVAGYHQSDKDTVCEGVNKTNQ